MVQRDYFLQNLQRQACVWSLRRGLKYFEQAADDSGLKKVYSYKKLPLEAQFLMACTYPAISRFVEN